MLEGHRQHPWELFLGELGIRVISLSENRAVTTPLVENLLPSWGTEPLAPVAGSQTPPGWRQGHSQAQFRLMEQRPLETGINLLQLLPHTQGGPEPPLSSRLLGTSSAVLILVVQDVNERPLGPHRWTEFPRENLHCPV